MATGRRSRKKTASINLKDLIIPAVGLGLLSTVARHVTRGDFFLFIALVVGGVVAVLVIRRRKRIGFDSRLSDAITRHEHGLISYYYQTRREDHFGNVDEAKWTAQIDTFLRTKVVSERTNFRAWRRSHDGQRAASMVDQFTRDKIAADRENRPLAHVEAGSLTPIEYERYCGEILRRCGWTVQLTQASRDGGADFVAEKDGHRLVAQCKRYAKPVGNKAVQEVHSAVRLYNGNAACVIAPMGFTAQAQREAHALSIGLLHHSALESFADKLDAPNCDPVRRTAGI